MLVSWRGDYLEDSVPREHCKVLSWCPGLEMADDKVNWLQIRSVGFHISLMSFCAFILDVYVRASAELCMRFVRLFHLIIGCTTGTVIDSLKQVQACVKIDYCQQEVALPVKTRCLISDTHTHTPPQLLNFSCRPPVSLAANNTGSTAPGYLHTNTKCWRQRHGRHAVSHTVMERAERRQNGRERRKGNRGVALRKEGQELETEHCVCLCLSVDVLLCIEVQHRKNREGKNSRKGRTTFLSTHLKIEV